MNQYFRIQRWKSINQQFRNQQRQHSTIHKPTIQKPTTPTFNYSKIQVTNDPEIDKCTANIW
jgi:hypothetical protein